MTNNNNNYQRNDNLTKISNTGSSGAMLGGSIGTKPGPNKNG